MSGETSGSGDGPSVRLDRVTTFSETERPKRFFERSAVRAWIAFVAVLAAGGYKTGGVAGMGSALLEQIDLVVEMFFVALGFTASTSKTSKPDTRAAGLLPNRVPTAPEVETEQ